MDPDLIDAVDAIARALARQEAESAEAFESSYGDLVRDLTSMRTPRAPAS